MLPAGFRNFTVDELRDLCVKEFPESTVRADIMAGFEVIYEQAASLGIEGEFWINGSFLTRKIDPDDIDFLLVTDSKFRDHGNTQQTAFIEWLINNERDPKKSFRCDTDAVFRFPQDSPWYEHFTGSVLRHWEENVYGKSVSTGILKGIAVILLTKPKRVETATEAVLGASNREKGEER